MFRDLLCSGICFVLGSVVFQVVKTTPDDIRSGKSISSFILDVVKRELCLIDEKEIKEPSAAVMQKIFNAAVAVLLVGR